MLEQARGRIVLNSSTPGLTQTDTTRSLTQQHHRNLLTRTPAGRPVHPDGMADAVAFLAGAGHVRGAVTPLGRGAGPGALRQGLCHRPLYRRPRMTKPQVSDLGFRWRGPPGR
ncbi:hypothetical protein ACFYWX_31825 [Streptomyces sp. NPDC002888]|uniref:hypothetical protein n=1 Tax=Streptomyces sp. NPDC002888 TaxID=3364668 RepID=UPI003677AF47